MKTPTTSTPTTLALLAALAAGCATLSGTPALAGHGHDPACPASTEGPHLKASEIVRKAEDAGFEVIEFEAKHGCWEIEALDATRVRYDIGYDAAGRQLWLERD